MAQGKKHFFFAPKTLCRCWVQQRSRRIVEDSRLKRSCNKKRQIFGGSLSFFVLKSACTRRSQRQISAGPLFFSLSVMFG